MNQSTDGRDATLSALKELKKHGYLVLEKIINEKHRILGTRYMAYEQPLENPLEGGQIYRRREDGSEQLMEESTEVKVRSTKIRKEIEAEKKPQTGFPDTDFPEPENPTLNKNELSNTECTDNDSFFPSFEHSTENQGKKEGKNPDEEAPAFPEIDYRYLVAPHSGGEPQVEEIQRLVRRLWGKKRYRFKDEMLDKKEIRGMLSCLTWRHIAWVQERFDEACRDREIKNISGYLASLIFDACLCAETSWAMPFPQEGIGS